MEFVCVMLRCCCVFLDGKEVGMKGNCFGSYGDPRAVCCKLLVKAGVNLAFQEPRTGAPCRCWCEQLSMLCAVGALPCLHV